ncbi:MAG: hypothetical protein FWE36_00105 [Erysipelotrichales bacterium]|nr:hypothetical protein [Erysipelotrichales bacterium]
MKEKQTTDIREIVVDDYDMNGFQVVRREFFAHTFDPAISFHYDKVLFNMAAVKKLTNYNYIQMLIDPTNNKLLIRGCHEDSKDAVKWCYVDKKGKRKNRDIKCNIFTGKVFDMMKWDPNNKYKIQGTVIRTSTDIFMFFNLEEVEIFLPAAKDKYGIPTKMGKKPFYPENWRDSFGLEITDHEKAISVGILDKYAKFEVIHQKKGKRQLEAYFKENERINITTSREELNYDPRSD